MSGRRFQVDKNDVSDDSNDSYDRDRGRSNRNTNRRNKDSDDSDDDYDEPRRNVRGQPPPRRPNDRPSGRAQYRDDDDDDDDDQRDNRKGNRANIKDESPRDNAWERGGQSSNSSNPRTKSSTWMDQPSKSNTQPSRNDNWNSAKPMRNSFTNNNSRAREYESRDEEALDAEFEEEDRRRNRTVKNVESNGGRSKPLPPKPKSAAPDGIRDTQNRTNIKNMRSENMFSVDSNDEANTNNDEDMENQEIDDNNDDDNDTNNRHSKVDQIHSEFDTNNEISEEKTTSIEDFVRHSRESNDRFSGSNPLHGSSHSFVLVAHHNGGDTDHVQCVIVRDRSSISSKMTPTYRLYLENKNKLLILAQKSQFNRTSNYHMYDMTRGIAGSKLSKKSGNYLGKLRARNVNRTEYVLITQASEREEVAAIVFDRHGIVDQLKEGSLPRKMSVMVPQLDLDSVPVANRTRENGMGSMVDMLNNNDDGNMFVFESKEPVFENGNFRLNFRGRVSVPSVKNFQLVSADDIDHVICQFGKIGDDRYHLDYKTPLNAFQAFALALCQFNL